MTKEANVFAEYRVLNHWTYLAGAIFIVLVPGLSTPSVFKDSASNGMKGGYLVACGVLIGDAVLMSLAWAGVTTLIEITPILFNIICYLDASYLLYLGSKILYATLKGKNNEAKPDEPQYGVVLKRALILNLTNSKATLFYVPPFVQLIDINAPYTGISFFILATTLGLVSSYYLSFPIISGTFITQYIRAKKKLTRMGNSLIDLIFVGFTARLATLQP